MRVSAFARCVEADCAALGRRTRRRAGHQSATFAPENAGVGGGNDGDGHRFCRRDRLYRLGGAACGADSLGEDQRFFLPGTMLAGRRFLSVASVLSKVIIRRAVSVGIVTSFIGVPFFFWIVLTKR